MAGGTKRLKSRVEPAATAQGAATAVATIPRDDPSPSAALQQKNPSQIRQLAPETEVTGERLMLRLINNIDDKTVASSEHLTLDLFSSPTHICAAQ
jgi:hypothetical protein